MRLLHLRSDGTAKAEHIYRLRKPIIEVGDEMYPVCHEAVFTHRDHELPPIAIMWQGLMDWEGLPPNIKRAAAHMKLIEMAKQHNQGVRISKHWVRQFLYGCEFFFKMMATGYLIGFVLLMGWWLSL